MTDTSSNSAVPDETDVYPRARPWLTILLTMLVMGAFLLAQSLVFVAILAIELQRNENLNLDELLEKSQNDGDVLGVCMLASLAAVPLVFGAAYWLSRGAVREFLGLRMPTAKQAVIWLVVVVAYVALVDGLTWLLGGEVVPPFMREAYLTAGVPILLWLALTVAAPVTEELLFRGLLFGGLRTSALGPVGAALISSAVWTAIHVQYDVISLIPILLGGLLLAAARQATNSVVLCVLMHSVWNAIATIEAALALQNG